MTGFQVTGSNLHYSAMWASHEEVDGEPFFILVHKEGAVGMVTLDYIRDSMQSVYDGDLNIHDMFYELYAKFPESSVLEQVTVSLSEESGVIRLHVISETGVQWTCDL
jgi:hypothetical protein